MCCVCTVLSRVHVKEDEQMIQFCFIYVLYTPHAFKRQVMKIK